MFYNENELLQILKNASENLQKGFTDLIPAQPNNFNKDNIENIVVKLSERLKNNYPYFHPLYAGQMLRPPHPAAQLAYALAMIINPNNHALDGGRATSDMEKESVAEIANMFGWKNHLGHLTGGGTIANLEALWIAGEISPNKKIAASNQAHYTHKRISHVLKLQFEEIPVNNEGRMDCNYLEEKLKEGNIGTVVATIGTTAVGAVDELKNILELKNKYGFRIHTDAAYGGYFILSNTLNSKTYQNYELLNKVDSIVIDPHKHGLQPYGCGSVIFNDPSVGKFYKHDSPYTYFSSSELHLGEISLECSRPGAAAAALWTTMKLFPLIKGGEFSQQLDKCRNAALKFYSLLAADNKWITSFLPELDIITWLPNGSTLNEISEKSKKLFDICAKNNLHLALANLPIKFYKVDEYIVSKKESTVTALRSVLMKPEHFDWVDKIYDILCESYNEIK